MSRPYRVRRCRKARVWGSPHCVEGPFFGRFSAGLVFGRGGAREPVRIFHVAYFCIYIITQMLPPVSAPSFDRKGESSANYAQQVALWREVTNLGPAKRASALILHLDTVARNVCVAAESDAIMVHEGVEKIAE